MPAGRVTNVLRRSALASPSFSSSFVRNSSTAAPKATRSIKSIVEETAAEKQNEPDMLASTIPVKSLRAGQAIRPHELSYDARVAGTTHRKKPVTVAPINKLARMNDPFYQLSIDPLTLATNASVLTDYVTEMGQIKPRTQTGLTVKSQRKLGKAIRRARMMGVLPLLSRMSGRQ